MVRASVVQVLLFIAAISASTMFVGVIVTESGLYAQSIEDESDRETAVIDTEIAIVNDAEAGTTYNASDEQVTVYVKNVGGAPLEPTALDVVLNGEYVQPDGMKVFEADTWREGTVLELTVSASLEQGTHRVAVEINDARETLEFEVA